VGLRGPAGAGAAFGSAPLSRRRARPLPAAAPHVAGGSVFFVRPSNLLRCVTRASQPSAALRALTRALSTVAGRSRLQRRADGIARAPLASRGTIPVLGLLGVAAAVAVAAAPRPARWWVWRCCARRRRGVYPTDGRCCSATAGPNRVMRVDEGPTLSHHSRPRRGRARNAYGLGARRAAHPSTLWWVDRYATAFYDGSGRPSTFA